MFDFSNRTNKVGRREYIIFLSTRILKNFKQQFSNYSIKYPLNNSTSRWSLYCTQLQKAHISAIYTLVMRLLLMSYECRNIRIGFLYSLVVCIEF